MAARFSPATIVVCAAGGRANDVASRRSAAAVTPVVALEAVLGGGCGGDGSGVALAIDPRWLSSRQALRQALVRARRALPRLEAAVLRGAALAHHGVVAEEGIRVVLVDEFAAVGRGSRRPAPSGWPCRSVAWGLWEVRTCAPRRGWGRGWLPGWPAPRQAALHAAMADDRGVGGPRLQRLVAWAERAVARGQAVAVTLAELPALLEGRRQAPLSASVLRAA